jgi:sugar lactone lactonase YvrE
MNLQHSDWQICARSYAQLGESVLWHPEEEALYWTDFYGPSVYRQKKQQGPIECWKVAPDGLIGSLVFANHGRLVLALEHSIATFETGKASSRPFANPKAARNDLAYNDAKVDRAGRYWVGTWNLAESESNALFYCVAADGTSTIADKDFVICNGPTFSPDNRTLYLSDTMGRRILSYDLSQDGILSGRRTFFTFSPEDGMPDGITADSEGNIWCALYGGSKIVCIADNGVLKQTLALPTPLVTSLCFGGPSLKTIYATTGWKPGVTEETKTLDIGGAVFMREVEVAGLPEPILNI